MFAFPKLTGQLCEQWVGGWGAGEVSRDEHLQHARMRAGTALSPMTAPSRELGGQVQHWRNSTQQSKGPGSDRQRQHGRGGNIQTRTEHSVRCTGRSGAGLTGGAGTEEQPPRDGGRGPAGVWRPPGPGLGAPWMNTCVNVSTFGDFLPGPQRKRQQESSGKWGSPGSLSALAFCLCIAAPSAEWAHVPLLEPRVPASVPLRLRVPGPEAPPSRRGC